MLIYSHHFRQEKLYFVQITRELITTNYVIEIGWPEPAVLLLYVYNTGQHNTLSPSKLVIPESCLDLQKLQ